MSNKRKPEGPTNPDDLPEATLITGDPNLKATIGKTLEGVPLKRIYTTDKPKEAKPSFWQSIIPFTEPQSIPIVGNQTTKDGTPVVQPIDWKQHFWHLKKYNVTEQERNEEIVTAEQMKELEQRLFERPIAIKFYKQLKYEDFPIYLYEKSTIHKDIRADLENSKYIGEDFKKYITNVLNDDYTMFLEILNNFSPKFSIESIPEGPEEINKYRQKRKRTYLKHQKQELEYEKEQYNEIFDYIFMKGKTVDGLWTFENDDIGPLQTRDDVYKDLGTGYVGGKSKRKTLKRKNKKTKKKKYGNNKSKKK